MRTEVTRIVQKLVDAETSEKIGSMLLDELTVLFDSNELCDFIFWNEDNPTIDEIVKKLLIKCHFENESDLMAGLKQIEAKETLMKLIEEKKIDYWRRHDDDEGISVELLSSMENLVGIEISKDFKWLLSTFGHMQSPNLVVMGLFRGGNREWEFPFVQETLRLRKEGLPDNYLILGQFYEKLLVIDEFGNLYEWGNQKISPLNVKFIPFLTDFLVQEREKELNKTALNTGKLE